MLEIVRLRQEQVKEAAALWLEAFRPRMASSLIGDWTTLPEAVAAFIESKRAQGRAYCAMHNSLLAGYLAWDEFEFHGAASAFCPVMAHATRQQSAERIAGALYAELARNWVARGIHDHFWSVFYDDQNLREHLFDLGFGSYVCDAFCEVRPQHAPDGSGCALLQANPDDSGRLMPLLEESQAYYAASPLFLRRESISDNELRELAARDRIWLACAGSEPVAVFHVAVAQEDNCVDLSRRGDGLTGELGIYIRPEYRGRGLGRSLLRVALDDLARQGITRLHVDFETANPCALRFWPRYFQRAILSLRRTVNRDAR